MSKRKIGATHASTLYSGRLATPLSRVGQKLDPEKVPSSYPGTADEWREAVLNLRALDIEEFELAMIEVDRALGIDRSDLVISPENFGRYWEKLAFRLLEAHVPAFKYLTKEHPAGKSITQGGKLGAGTAIGVAPRFPFFPTGTPPRR